MGGTQKATLDFSTPALFNDRQDDDFEAAENIYTMIFVDTIATKDSNSMQTIPHHKVHMKNMLPVYMHHIACGMRWKSCLYFAGGEIEGQWSK